MAGIDLGGGYGAGGAVQGLQDLIKQRFLVRQQSEQERAARASEDLRQQQINNEADIKRQMELDRQQHDRELGQTREENAVTRQVALMPRGTLVTQPQYNRLNQYGYGPLFSETTPSPAPPDALASASASTDATPASTTWGRGALITGAPSPTYRFGGTNQQDQFDTKTGEVYDRLASTEAIAAARQQAADARQQALDAYREQALGLRERDVARREQEYGDRVNPPDNPKNPRGVQTYLLDLRRRYGGNLQAAEDELSSAWPSIQQAHPHAEAGSVLGSLRSMFGAAPGVSKTSTLLNDLGINLNGNGSGVGVLQTGPAASGQVPRTQPAAAPAAAKTMTRDELRAVAQRLGISEQDAAQQATARGYRVQ